MQSSASGRSARPHRAPAVRSGFTLLELLIAIAIIGILASLVLTVAGSARKQATNTQVSVDIQDLAKGIASFKQKFGVEPPSHVTLYEQASGWSGDPRSMGIIRQIWPQFDFTYTAEGGSIDINGDGVYKGDGFTNPSVGAIYLSGSECLVFFLGGVPSTLTPLAPGGAPAGFSANPSDPFGIQLSAGTRTVVGTNRDRYTEFDAGRLVLLKPPITPAGQPHTMNAYLDTLPGQLMPYLYLSSYEGQGYDVAHELPAGPAGNQTFVDVYRQGPSGFTSPSPSPAWNPNSYQIISPGYDQQYGVGGEYEQGDPKGLLTGPRSTERDNIANFSSGPLAP
ncbi:MAG TPA: prepilin-type N-terminal cleavage/methylation domain-containing protein [Planctomycetaceae bacterium]|nr:prepilin-type N-terminal cleavage/methylation domain-containing protein [Planctomycetaceae bacterium]